MKSSVHVWGAVLLLSSVGVLLAANPASAYGPFSGWKAIATASGP